MSNDDDDKKAIREELEKNGITTVHKEDMPDDVEDVLTVRIIFTGEDDKAGIGVEWGKFGNPVTWDENNISSAQDIALVVISHLESIVASIAMANAETSARQLRSGMKVVDEDNIDDILKRLDDIDTDDMTKQ